MLIEALGNGVEVGNKFTEIEENNTPIAKIVFGELKSTNLKPLYNVGLLFIVSYPPEE